MVRSKWFFSPVLPVIVFVLLFSIAGCGKRGVNCAFDFDGNSAQPIAVETGEKIDLRALTGSGRAVFLNFWGIMCVSCLEELTRLNELYEDFKNGNVVFLAVNTDGLGKDELMKKMKEKGIKINFTVVADPDYLLTESFANGFIPHNVILSPSCEVVFEATGFNEGIFRQLTESLMEFR